MKRKVWTAVIVLGVLLMAGAAGLTVWNLHTDQAAAEERDSLLLALSERMPQTPQPEAQPEAEPMPMENGMPVVEIDGRNYMGAIYFPDLNRELPVLATYDLDSLKIAPAVLCGTPVGRDLVICAHNYRSHFGPLHRLPIGAQVQLKAADGTLYQYAVAATEVVSPFAVADVTNGAWDLTLFTCTLGGRTRYVARCDMV